MHTHRSRFAKRLGALVATGALAAGALAATAPAAQAAETTVDDATLTWSLSNEQGGGAFFGGCNFLSAGTAGDTTRSRVWTESDGFYKTVDGDVTVEKPNTDGGYSQPTWSTKCQQPNGAPVSAASTATTSGNRIKLTNGTGTLDAAADDATISWDGSFTSVFYGGLTYWSGSDLALTVEDGVGQLTATLSGYGADMEDTSKWVALEPATATLATFTGVDVTPSGLTDLPDYLGTSITVPEGASGQATKNSSNEAVWGAFPQSFVDFQQNTGQSSYWYTSGGSRDAAKPATALSVSVAAPVPEVTVGTTEIARTGTTSITVKGTGFAPSQSAAPAQPAGLSSGGVYATIGRFADTWKPSASAPGTARTVAKQLWALPPADRATLGPQFASSTVDLSPEGDFTATFQVSKADIDALTANPDGNLGVYTYTRKTDLPSFETATPLTIAAPAADITVDGLDETSNFGAERIATVTAATADGDPTPTGDVVAKISSIVVGRGTLDEGVAKIALARTMNPGERRAITFNYSGDGTYAGSTDTVQHTITKAPVDRFISITKIPTSKATGVGLVTVRGVDGGPDVKGTANVYFAKSGSKSKIVPVKLGAAGKGKFTAPKLTKGTWKVYIRYLGSTTHAESNLGLIKSIVVKS